AEIWPLLRVCWEGEDPTINCGRCEKCTRQMLCMLAVGVEDFSGFKSPPTAESVGRVAPHPGIVEREWRACYETAEREGRAGLPALRAMGEVLRRCEAAHTGAIAAPHAHGRRSPRWLRRLFRSR